MEDTGRRPDWDELFSIASTQSGVFAADQANDAGFSPQLLNHHINAGRILRRMRGIYRLAHYPLDDQEEFAVLWLWSNREGVFSHETALALHGLSDVLPSSAHLTVPFSWRRKSKRIPDGVWLYYGAVLDFDRAWMGSVPVTAPRRTLADCAATHVSPDILDQAIAQATARGLIPRKSERRDGP